MVLRGRAGFAGDSEQQSNRLFRTDHAPSGNCEQGSKSDYLNDRHYRQIDVVQTKIQMVSPLAVST
jgi:hypothetical protein